MTKRYNRSHDKLDYNNLPKVPINVDQLVGLTEPWGDSLFCEKCKTETIHVPKCHLKGVYIEEVGVLILGEDDLEMRTDEEVEALKRLVPNPNWLKPPFANPDCVLVKCEKCESIRVVYFLPWDELAAGKPLKDD